MRKFWILGIVMLLLAGCNVKGTIKTKGIDAPNTFMSEEREAHYISIPYTSTSVDSKGKVHTTMKTKRVFTHYTYHEYRNEQPEAPYFTLLVKGRKKGKDTEQKLYVVKSLYEGKMVGDYIDTKLLNREVWSWQRITNKIHVQEHR